MTFWDSKASIIDEKKGLYTVRSTPRHVRYEVNWLEWRKGPPRYGSLVSERAREPRRSAPTPALSSTAPWRRPTPAHGCGRYRAGCDRISVHHPLRSLSRWPIGLHQHDGCEAAECQRCHPEEGSRGLLGTLRHALEAVVSRLAAA